MTLAPGPDGSALVVPVACRTSRTGRSRVWHDVTVLPDWSLETPHDLATERIGVAFGGYLSCLDLADKALPAFRELMGLLLRTAVPVIGLDGSGGWVVKEPPPRCVCIAQRFASAGAAAAHVRKPEHVARKHGADPTQVTTLLEAAQLAHATTFSMPPPGTWHLADHVRDPGGLDQLWAAGIAPEVAAQIHQTVMPHGAAMPVWFYIGVVYRKPDLAWLTRTVAHTRDPDVAAWAAWTESDLDRADPEARGGWLRVGASRRVVEELLAGGLDPEAAVRLAAATGSSTRRAALVLAAWLRADCYPEPQDIALLDRLGIGFWYEPSPAAVAALWAESRTLRPPPTRTQAGLILALAGTRASALALLERGVRLPLEAAEALGEDLNHSNPKVASS